MATFIETQFAISIAGTVLGYASEATLTVNSDTIDTTSKMDGDWATQFPGKLSWQVTSSGLYTKDIKLIIDAWKARTVLDVDFGTISVTTDASGTKTASISGTHSGNALITSLEITSDAGEIAKFSITLDGDGELSSGGTGVKGSTYEDDEDS